MCSVFSASSIANPVSPTNEELTMGRFVTAVRNVIFRHHPEGRALLQEKIAFQRQYPDELPLDDSDNYDRGFSMSVRDPFFVGALSTVARLVDTGHYVLVGDFGCGRGDTSFLFALTGANVMGIENQTSAKEYLQAQQLHLYYTALAKKLGLPGLGLRMKPKTDARFLHEESEIEANRFSVLFMGNFLHMFDPATAKELIKEQAYRMLHRGGNVFASVDGVAAQGGSVDAYLKAVIAGKKFPSVMKATNYGKLSAEGEIEELNATTLFTHAEIDKAGRTTSECRRVNTHKWYYWGPDLKTDAPPTKRIPLYAELDRTICLYDSRLIGFVFPDSEWDVTFRRINIYGQYNLSLRDEEVAKWVIVAEKK
jgi:SAM-dependent methyltransferase